MDHDQEQIAAARAPRRPAIWRGVVIALVLAPLHTYWLINLEIVRGTGFSSTISLFFNVVLTLCVLLLVNMPLRRFCARWASSLATTSPSARATLGGPRALPRRRSRATGHGFGLLARAQFEDADYLRQRLRLILQGRGGSGGFFHQCGILLRDFIHLHHGAVDFVDADTLFLVRH